MCALENRLLGGNKGVWASVDRNLKFQVSKKYYYILNILFAFLS